MLNSVAQKTSFTVIGAGIVGLTVANALKSRGIPVQIFDRRKEKYHYPEFRINIDERGRKALQRTLPEPIFDKILNSSLETNQKVQFVKGKDLSPIRKLQSNAPINVISSSKLIKILLEELDVNWGANYVGFHPHKSQKDEVHAMFEGDKSIDSNFIIGCDGSYSTVRKQALSTDSISDTGFRYVDGKIGASLYTPSILNLLQNPITAIESNGYALTAYQLEEEGGGLSTRWQLSFLDQSYQGVIEKKSMNKEKQVLKEFCLESIKGWNSALVDLVSRTDSMNILFPQKFVYQLPASKIKKKNIILLGESAYAVSPFRFEGENYYFNDVDYFVKYLSNMKDSSDLVNEMTFANQVSGTTPSVKYQKEVEQVHATSFFKCMIRNYSWK